MTRLSQQLECEAEVARGNLAADFEELRHRMTTEQIVDQVLGYARDTPVSEFARNLLREIRENPVPLLLIGVGIAWAIIASSRRRQRIVVEECPPDATAPLGARELQFAATKSREGEVATAAPVPAISRRDRHMGPPQCFRDPADPILLWFSQSLDRAPGRCPVQSLQPRKSNSICTVLRAGGRTPKAMVPYLRLCGGPVFTRA